VLSAEQILERFGSVASESQMDANVGFPKRALRQLGIVWIVFDEKDVSLLLFFFHLSLWQ
jgi:hypothetical protein